MLEIDQDAPFSKKLFFDTELILSHSNIRLPELVLKDPMYIEILKSRSTEYLIESIESHPTPRDLLKLSKLSYEDFDSELYSSTLKKFPLKGWTVLTAASNTNKFRSIHLTMNGYHGVAFINTNARQIVIAHRGTLVTNLGSLMTDKNSVWNKKYTPQTSSAVTFVNIIKNFIVALNEKSKINFQLFITGHSLGGWLAQVTAYSFRYLTNNGHFFSRTKEPLMCYIAHTVVFESPGCKKMLEKMQRDFDVPTIFAKSNADALDIRSYLAKPNFINGLNEHIGAIYTINVASHRLEDMRQCFDESGQFSDNKISMVPYRNWYTCMDVGLPNRNIVIANAFSKREQIFLNMYHQDHDRFFCDEESLIVNHSLLRAITPNENEKFFNLNAGYSSEEVIPNVKALFQIFRIPDLSCLRYQSTYLGMLINESTRDFRRKYERSSLKFENDSLGIANFIENTRKKVLMIEVEENVTHAYFQVIDILNRVVEERYKVIMIEPHLSDLRDECLLTESVLLCVHDDQKPLSEDSCCNIEKFFRKLKITENAKVIFAVVEASPYSEILTTFLHDCQFKSDEIDIVTYPGIVWSELTSDSRKEMISRARLNFGGHVTKFADVFGDNYQEQFGKIIVTWPESLKKLIENQDFFVFVSTSPPIEWAIIEVHRLIEVSEIDKYLKEWTREGYFIIITSDLQEKKAKIDRDWKNEPVYYNTHLFNFQDVCLKHHNLKKIGCWVHLVNNRYYWKQSYDPNLYCSRRLIHPTKVIDGVMPDEKLIVRKNKDIMIFENEDDKKEFEDDMKKNHIGIRDAFEKLSESEKNLTWVKKFGDNHVVYNSDRSSQSMNIEDKEITVDENDFIEIVGDNVTVIIDEPGMGKSTVLRRIAFNHCESKWVIFIMLKECRKLIEELPAHNQISLDLIANFLVKANGKESGIDHEIVHELIKYKLEDRTGQWPLLLLFDGIDEFKNQLKENSWKKLTSLLATLKTKARICVTSRFQCKSELEKCLSVHSTKFEPLGSNSQGNYLQTLWKFQVGYNQSKAQKLAKQIIDKTDQLFTNSNQDKQLFIGVPLQLRFLGEGFRDTLSKISSTESDLSLKTFTLTSIFKTFINGKYRIFLEEKHGVDLISEASSLLFHSLKISFTRLHQRLALNELMKVNFLTTTPMFRFKEKFRDELCFVGLISSFQDDSPNFVHKTFLEYFVADCLNHSSKKKLFFQECTDIYKLFFKILSDQGNSMIRGFLDELLDEHLNPQTFSWEFESEINDLQQKALHICVEENRVALIKLLLVLFKGCPQQLQIILLSQDSQGKTPLRKAMTYEVLDIFVDLINNLDEYVIHDVLYSTAFTYDSDAEDEKLIYLLSKCGKYDNLRSISSQIQADWELMQPFLIGVKKGSVNSISNKLSEVIEETRVRLILMKKSKMDISMDDMNALHIAAEQGHVEILRYLLLLAGDEKQTECILSLSQPNEKRPLHFAAKGGHLEAVKCLIEHGAKIDMTDIYEKNLLHLAVRQGKIDIVRLLIKNGSEIDFKNENCATPLHLAAWRGRLDVVKCLLAHGAQTNVKTGKQSSALHLAAHKGHFEVVNALLEHGVEIDARNKNNSTPLHLAARQGHIKARNGRMNVIECLIRKGASVDAQDINMKTPLHIAVDGGRLKVIECLIREGSTLSPSYIGPRFLQII